MNLPVKTTMEDVDKVVAYLKSKPTGATVAEAKGIIDAKHLDGRKLNAYRTWGLITHEGGRISLTDDGRRIARQPDERSNVLLGAIDRLRPYRAAIEWAHHQGFDTITLEDLAAQWHTHHSEAIGQVSETSLKDAVTCFFNLAEGAALGTYILGRRGTPTRLELDKSAVARFAEAGPSAPPWAGPEVAAQDAGVDVPESSDQPEAPSPDKEEQETPREDRKASARLRVFIAHGQNMRVVEQVRTMLELAKIDAEVAEEEETTAIPVPNKVLAAMRRSDAGIICVNADEGRKREDGTYTINENVLIEVGAAFVLYDQRVILLWDKRLPVPSNLQGLYRCEFEGDEIGWDAGMKLMKALSQFE